MFKFEHLKKIIAVFTSNAISDHEISFEIKRIIKHIFRFKLGKSSAYRASTQFTRMRITIKGVIKMWIRTIIL